MLSNILTGSSSAGITLTALIYCLLVSLALGAFIALIHGYKNICRTNFLITLVILPAIVASVIMLVNGNIGTGVAVMGAFSLIRFRSAPGNSREIASIFLAMAAGLAVGTGYLGVAVIITVVIGIAITLVLTLPFGARPENMRDLKVTIPETLDYRGIFDEIFKKYTTSAILSRVRTVNLGSLYELDYIVLLRPGADEKEMLDEIRERNGNLPIVCGYLPERDTEL